MRNSVNVNQSFKPVISVRFGSVWFGAVRFGRVQSGRVGFGCAGVRTAGRPPLARKRDADFRLRAHWLAKFIQSFRARTLAPAAQVRGQTALATIII